MIKDINREWESVCCLGERKNYPAGHEIRLEGDHFDDFFYLSSGKITSFYLKDAGAINIAIFYEHGVLLNEKVSILGFCESPTRYLCETAITGFQFPARLLGIHKSGMARCRAHLKLHGMVSQFAKTRLRIEDRERLRELSLTHAAPASLAF